MRFIVGLFLASALTVGCTSTIMVDGLKVKEEAWQQLQETLRTRASFDFDCPREKILLTLVAVGYQNGRYPGDMPVSAGAAGCDRRAVYTIGPSSQWILNSPTK